MQSSANQDTGEGEPDNEKQSLEDISKNISNTLFGNCAQNQINNDNNEPDGNEKNKDENTNFKETDKINTSNSKITELKLIKTEITKVDDEKAKEENNNAFKSEKIVNKLEPLQNNIINPPLNQFIDALESSTKNKTEDSNSVKKEANPENSTNEQLNKNDNKSNTDTSRSQASYYSTSSYSTSSKSPPTKKKNQSTNQKNQKNNNQPPQLPGKLPQIVIHSPDSLTYKALTLQSLPPMNRETRSSVVLDLSGYINQCSQAGMIAEANFIQEVSESVKKIQTPRKLEIQQLKLKGDLDNCEHEIEAQNLYWDEQEKAAENDYNSLMEELDERLNDDLESLDREWQDPKKSLSYSKPSPALLNYRYVANKLIGSKNFSSIPQLSKIISQKHDEEAYEASLRMKSDYKLAEANLMTKYQKEKETIEKMHQSKLDNINRMKERSLIPMQSRKKLMEAKSAKLKTLQQKSPQTSFFTSSSSPVISNFDNTTLNDLIAQPKLKLPPMKTAKRSTTSLSTTTKAKTLGNRKKNDSKILSNTSKSLNSPCIKPLGTSGEVQKSNSRRDIR